MAKKKRVVHKKVAPTGRLGYVPPVGMEDAPPPTVRPSRLGTPVKRAVPMPNALPARRYLGTRLARGKSLGLVTGWKPHKNVFDPPPKGRPPRQGWV